MLSITKLKLENSDDAIIIDKVTLNNQDKCIANRYNLALENTLLMP